MRQGDLYIVYTKEAETADSYIERTTYELGKRHRVRVATSDNAEQMIILGHGALRLSARQLHDEIERTGGQIEAIVRRGSGALKSDALRQALEKAEKKN